MTVTETDTAQEVLAAEQSLRNAMTTRNWDAFSDVLSEDLLYCHANGKLQDKTEYLAGLAKGSHRYACERKNMRVRVYGDTAVTAGRQMNTTVGLGVTYHHVIQVWRREDGKWRMVNQQSSRLGQPD